MKIHGVEKLKGGLSHKSFLVQALDGTWFNLQRTLNPREAVIQLVTRGGCVVFSARLAFKTKAERESFIEREVHAKRALQA